MNSDLNPVKAEPLALQHDHPAYRQDIDGLRAIAVLIVVGFHAFPKAIPGGFIGVDVFFVISGFLITSIILKSLENKNFSFIDFYSRRIRRIFPALLVVMSACLILGWFALLSNEYAQLGKHAAGGAGFFINFILRRESGYFDNVAETKPLLHLWSLSIEEQFYIILPLLLWLAWKCRLNLLATISFAATLSFFLNLTSTDAVRGFYFPQMRFWELLIGGVFAYVSMKGCVFWTSLSLERIHSNRKCFTLYAVCCMPRTFASRNARAWLGLLLITAGVFIITKSHRFPGWWALFPVIGTILLISTGGHAWFNRVILSNRVLVWIGLISYPLYLWHWPLLSFARIIEGETPPATIRIAAVFLSFALAWLTYRFVEIPLRFGKRSKWKVIALIVLMVAVGISGRVIKNLDGLEERSAVKAWSKNKVELERLPAKDEACKAYVNIKEPPFPYCRYTKGMAPNIVAVIGDSHAHVAYPGIAKKLQENGIGTILMANSSCPPFMGGEHGTSEEEKRLCKNRIDTIIRILNDRSDIKHVFIFSRGPVYLTGKGFGEELKTTNGHPIIETDVFRSSLQSTIDVLNRYGKKVYYVTENPELGIDATAYLSRPFRIGAKTRPALSKEIVLARQKDYLNMLGMLSGVTVINALKSFCSVDTCLALTENDILLYQDSDHLSVTGSDFQANTVLRQYLEAIKNENL
jgi:peptidoglycan/LPS O-acetylase OafA/YrhL